MLGLVVIGGFGDFDHVLIEEVFRGTDVDGDRRRSGLALSRDLLDVIV